MTPLEVIQHILELLLGGARLEPEYPVDDMIGSGLVGRIEVSGFSGGFERSHHDPSRIRAQMQRLSVQECGRDKRLLRHAFNSGAKRQFLRQPGG